MLPECRCCWTPHEGRGLYCPPCVAFHGRSKLAPKDDNGDTTCPAALASMRRRAARLAAMPSPSKKPTRVDETTEQYIASIEPGWSWRGNH